MSFLIGVLDLETTGLSQEEGHRIIEFGLAVYQTLDGEKFVKVGRTWVRRINPLRSIDEKAKLVHGIELSDLKDEPEWEEVAPKVSKVLNKLDVVVCHNAEFDAPFVALELVRAEFELPNFEVFCTMAEGRAATPLGTLPSLQVLCWAFDVEYDTKAAHAADYDVDVTAKCLFKGLDTGFYSIPALDAYKCLKNAA